MDPSDAGTTRALGAAGAAGRARLEAIVNQTGDGDTLVVHKSSGHDGVRPSAREVDNSRAGAAFYK
ncbi:MAG: hypothetical protein HY286_00170 [Planctomycetes bacterium]|nr:hypothetical protein [Planctomycetota bacterium]